MQLTSRPLNENAPGSQIYFGEPLLEDADWPFAESDTVLVHTREDAVLLLPAHKSPRYPITFNDPRRTDTTIDPELTALLATDEPYRTGSRPHHE